MCCAVHSLEGIHRIHEWRRGGEGRGRGKGEGKGREERRDGRDIDAAVAGQSWSGSNFLFSLGWAMCASNWAHSMSEDWKLRQGRGGRGEWLFWKFTIRLTYELKSRRFSDNVKHSV